MSCYPLAGIAVRATGALLYIAAVLLGHGCKSAIAGGGRDDGGLVHAAATPLRDVGLLRPEVPDALKDLRYPYSLTALTAPTVPDDDCAVVAEAITAMDVLLGEESYQPSADQGLGSRAAAG